jgi:hypothetical protein
MTGGAPTTIKRLPTMYSHSPPLRNSNGWALLVVKMAREKEQLGFDDCPDVARGGGKVTTDDLGY